MTPSSGERHAMALAGDIGGTHSRLLACDAAGRPAPERVYASADYRRLEDLVADFAADTGLAFQAACFGLPGPVVAGRCRLTNNA
jgi:glucokinase